MPVPRLIASFLTEGYFMDHVGVLNFSSRTHTSVPPEILSPQQSLLTHSTANNEVLPHTNSQEDASRNQKTFLKQNDDSEQKTMMSTFGEGTAAATLDGVSVGCSPSEPIKTRKDVLWFTNGNVIFVPGDDGDEAVDGILQPFSQRSLKRPDQVHPAYKILDALRELTPEKQNAVEALPSNNITFMHPRTRELPVSVIRSIVPKRYLPLYSSAVTPAPLDSYIHQILTLMRSEEEEILIALVLLAKVSTRIPICTLSVARMFLTAMVVSSKLRADERLSMRAYATYGGVEVMDMLAMERAFLTALGFDAGVRPEHYGDMVYSLRNYCAMAANDGVEWVAEVWQDLAPHIPVPDLRHLEYERQEARAALLLEGWGDPDDVEACRRERAMWAEARKQTRMPKRVLSDAVPSRKSSSRSHEKGGAGSKAAPPLPPQHFDIDPKTSGGAEEALGRFKNNLAADSDANANNNSTNINGHQKKRSLPADDVVVVFEARTPTEAPHQGEGEAVGSLGAVEASMPASITTQSATASDTNARMVANNAATEAGLSPNGRGWVQQQHQQQHTTLPMQRSLRGGLSAGAAAGHSAFVPHHTVANMVVNRAGDTLEFGQMATSSSAPPPPYQLKSEAAGIVIEAPLANNGNGMVSLAQCHAHAIANAYVTATDDDNFSAATRFSVGGLTVSTVNTYSSSAGGTAVFEGPCGVRVSVCGDGGEGCGGGGGASMGMGVGMMGGEVMSAGFQGGAVVPCHPSCSSAGILPTVAVVAGPLMNVPNYLPQHHMGVSQHASGGQHQHQQLQQQGPLHWGGGNSANQNIGSNNNNTNQLVVEGGAFALATSQHPLLAAQHATGGGCVPSVHTHDSYGNSSNTVYADPSVSTVYTNSGVRISRKGLAAGGASYAQSYEQYPMEMVQNQQRQYQQYQQNQLHGQQSFGANHY